MNIENASNQNVRCAPTAVEPATMRIVYSGASTTTSTMTWRLSAME